MIMLEVRSPMKQAAPPIIATMNVARDTAPQIMPVPTYHANDAAQAFAQAGS